MQIHQIDQHGFYTDQSREQSHFLGVPKGWTSVELPDIPSGKLARLHGSQWQILDDKPADVLQEELNDARAEAMARIKSGHASALSTITDRFPQTEREGWSTLIAQAHAGTGDMIAAYAQGLGVSLAEGAARIVTASQTTELMYGQATGILTALRDQVDAAYQAGDVAALQAIAWLE